MRSALTIITIISLAGSAWAGPIVVNEFYSGFLAVSGTTKMAATDYIEFAITQNMTSTQLAALAFGDTNATTSAISGVFQFDKPTLDGVLASAGRTDFLAGTLIVVKGASLGAQNLTYNPLSSNIGNADAWSIELVAGQGAKDAPETTINGDISFSTAGDIAWIASSVPTSATNTSGFISAIGNSSGALGTVGNAVVAQFGASSIYNGTLPFGSAIESNGGSPPTLTQVAGGTLTTPGGTMGTPNNAADTTFLTGLRTTATSIAPEPGRSVLVLLGAAAMILRRRRP
jgi:hypothetical protein